jgi:hypothetical protein
VLTVAVCTWNRATLLARTLAALTRLRIPAGLDWELVVVDNGSSDDTAAVVAGFADRLPVRRLLEPRTGLSHARNAAVAAARGETIVWTDDDVLVEPEWLAAYAAALARWPDADVFGGPILPHFDEPPPTWLQRGLPQVANAYALLDLGPEPVLFDERRLPFGANYAIRTAAQRRVPYSPELGRVGTALRSGEETMVVRALLAAGACGRWVPEARVAHLVPRARQNLRFLRAYYRGNGASSHADPSFHGAEHGRRLLGRPRWVWRQAVEQQLLYWLRRPTAPPERWLLHLRLASSAWGTLLARVPGEEGRAGG